MASQTKFKLPSIVSSMQELEKLILDIREYSRWYSHYSILKRVSKKRVSDPPKQSQATSEAIHSWLNGKTISQGELNNLINHLTKVKKTAKVISFTLAATPPENTKKSLIDWCRNNLDPSLLVSFQFNSTILGGIVVKYGSHIYDWSFKQKIMANRNNFPEVLRNV